MRGAAARWMVHPRLGLHLALLGVLLSLPSLWIGWQLDDHTYRFVLTGDGAEGMAPFQVFTLLPGDPAVNRQLTDAGYLPWWTSESFRIAFFRYVSVLTMWLDYRLWPDSAWLMHAHSLAWFAWLAAAVVLFYRQYLGLTVTAGLAALLYVLDDARGVPVAWLANRNALTATVFGVLSLWAHDRWRRDGWKPGLVAGPAMLALSLASGEMGLGTVAYLAAHAVFLDRGGFVRRLAGLAPSGAVLLLWALVYRALGYGVEASALYLDPVRSPSTYLAALPGRLTLNLMGQWSPVPADLAGMLPDAARGPLLLFGVIVAVVVVAALVPLLVRDALARFFGLGMLLSLVPVAGTFASNRLLMFAGLGGMGLLAQFLAGVFGSAAWLPQTRAVRAGFRMAAWSAVLVHLVVAPAGLALAAKTTRMIGDAELAAIATIPSDGAIAQQDLVIVNAPDFLIYVSHIRAIRHFEGRPYAARIRALAPSPVPVVVRRPDDRTLDVRLGGGLFAGPLGPLFRDRRRPFAAGDRIELTGFTVTVLEASPDGDLVEARFGFAVPLEDRSLRWVRWGDGGYEPFTPPPVGGLVTLAAPRGVMEQYR